MLATKIGELFSSVHAVPQSSLQHSNQKNLLHLSIYFCYVYSKKIYMKHLIDFFLKNFITCSIKISSMVIIFYKTTFTQPKTAVFSPQSLEYHVTIQIIIMIFDFFFS